MVVGRVASLPQELQRRRLAVEEAEGRARRLEVRVEEREEEEEPWQQVEGVAGPMRGSEQVEF